MKHTRGRGSSGNATYSASCEHVRVALSSARMRSIVLAVWGILAIAACGESARENPKRPAISDSLRAELARQEVAAKAIVAAQDRAKARADSEALRARRAELDALSRRFRFHADQIRGGGSFSPGAMESVGGTRLTCSVDSSGAVRLKSIYVGDDAIFHNRIVARIGTRVVETQVVRPRVPGLGPSVLESDSVFEMGFFDEGAEDGGLMRALASADSGTIRIRLEGDAGRQDYVLSARSRRAIRHCVRLGELVRLER